MFVRAPTPFVIAFGLLITSLCLASAAARRCWQDAACPAKCEQCVRKKKFKKGTCTVVEGKCCETILGAGRCNKHGACISPAIPSTLLSTTPTTCGTGIGGDPHMVGFQGQNIDWMGEDGGWYVLLSDGDDVTMAVRLTAPLSVEFPDRQLITGFALQLEDNHSLVIETKEPYTTETGSCPEDWDAPCLSENALRVTVDSLVQPSLPTEIDLLPGMMATLGACNLPAECQPYGSDVIWAERVAAMSAGRRLATQSLSDWAFGWADSTAAPSWCEKFLAELGDEGLLGYSGKHSVFRIDTPTLTVRLHHGTNHQGGEVLDDGRVLPELEYWQMDVHLERFNIDAESVTGILGETMRPVLDDEGNPIMSGLDALRGDVEDYRVSGPLTSDFIGCMQ